MWCANWAENKGKQPKAGESYLGRLRAMGAQMDAAVGHGIHSLAPVTQTGQMPKWPQLSPPYAQTVLRNVPSQHIKTRTRKQIHHTHTHTQIHIEPLQSNSSFWPNPIGRWVNWVIELLEELATSIPPGGGMLQLWAQAINMPKRPAVKFSAAPSILLTLKKSNEQLLMF